MPQGSKQNSIISVVFTMMHLKINVEYLRQAEPHTKSIAERALLIKGGTRTMKTTTVTGESTDSIK